jgi:hypothetical protein
MSRVPICTCDGSNADFSPLLQVRWKRLVVDEGHNTANLGTNLTPFARRLSVERRWIVTGTPTTNLLGLSFGKGDTLAMDSDYNQEHGPEDVGTAEHLLAEAQNAVDPTKSFRAPFSVLSTNRSNMRVAQEKTARIWTKYDRQDLLKLHTMMKDFLGFTQFTSQPKLFFTNVIDPLFEPNGPAPGAIKVLEQVMQTCMFRHR